MKYSSFLSVITLSFCMDSQVFAEVQYLRYPKPTAGSFNISNAGGEPGTCYEVSCAAGGGAFLNFTAPYAQTKPSFVPPGAEGVGALNWRTITTSAPGCPLPPCLANIQNPKIGPFNNADGTIIYNFDGVLLTVIFQGISSSTFTYQNKTYYFQRCYQAKPPYEDEVLACFSSDSNSTCLPPE